MERVIFNFGGGNGGAFPNADLAMDGGGSFYGTTYLGGTANDGSVFKVKFGKNKKYSFRVLYSFRGGASDGASPWAGVSLDAVGNIYGTTRYGGSQNNEGTVWQLKLAKGQYKETILHAFEDTSGNDGYAPLAGVILFKGNLYGTTSSGGTNGRDGGTVFKVVP